MKHRWKQGKDMLAEGSVSPRATSLSGSNSGKIHFLMIRKKGSALNNFFLIFFLFLSLISVLSFPQPVLSDPDRGQTSSRPIITDSLKRKVEIPLRVNRVLSLQPEISRLMVALGGGEHLVGIDRFLRFEDHLFHLIYPPAKELPLIALTDESINAETILRFQPDVVFVSPSEPSLAESLSRKLTMPVIALSSMGRFDLLLEELVMTAQVVNKEERAAELKACFEEKLAWLSELLKPVVNRPKPRVYLAFWSSLLMTPVYYDPVKAAGGLNLAEGLLPSYSGTVRTVVSLEQILRWNPDIILVHGNYPPQERQVTVEKIIQDKRLSYVEAVKKKKVYYTFGFWYWWDPAEALFECFYLASLFYPELREKINLQTLGEEIFAKFYHAPQAFSHLLQILGTQTFFIEDRDIFPVRSR
jgi:iron complex transport system substrate-binding protein